MRFLLLVSLPLFAVDFTTDIHPILAKRCLGCHSGEKPQGGLSLANRAAAARVLERGGTRLMSRLNGTANPQMPPVGDPLAASEVAKIKDWLDAGAEWPNTAATVSKWVAPLAPRTLEVPAGTAANPIDRFIGLGRVSRVSDNLFARRAYYDITGLPPTPSDLDRFEISKDRVALVDELLLNKARYTGHWISFWNDLLHNDIGVVYHGDRKSITSWLERALMTNMPYDQIVRELLNPIGKDSPDGFLVGVNWRGDVNASQTPFMQASQNTAQVFLGINLKCASCHDSFINKYKLKEAYGLAAMFSDQDSLELVRCDNKTGVFTGPQFLYPELGTVASGLSLAERHATAAKLFTDPRNGRLARTLANRYWQRLLGRGIVEPVDDMDAEPWNADLLDWLAFDFAAHNYDIKHLIRQIMTSDAYQMETVTGTAGKVGFEGPAPRRLTAEEFADTVSSVTGEWRIQPSNDASHYVRDWQLKSSPLTRALGRPIRDQVFTTRESAPTTFQALELVNGAGLGLLLRRGSRRLLNALPDPPPNLYDSKAVRKGEAAFDIDISGKKQLWLLMEDAGSYDPLRTIAGIAGAELVTSTGVVNLTDAATISKFELRSVLTEKRPINGVQVLSLGRQLIYNVEGLNATRLRGRLVLDDSAKESDIGSAVRFFVFGSEPDHEQLTKVAGDRPVPAPPTFASVDDLIRYSYRAILSRDPSATERAIAVNYIGAKAQPAEVEDLLWSLLLHPEVQYIW